MNLTDKDNKNEECDVNNKNKSNARLIAPIYERICRVALIAMCSIAALIAPLYWIFADAPEFIGLEKRYRAGWPDFGADSFLSGRWGERVDSWMADKMPAREFFVGIDSYIWYLSGRQSARDVYVGKGGSLVEAPSAYEQAELNKRLGKIADFMNKEADEPPDFAKTVLLTPLDAGYLAPLPPRLARGYRDDIIANEINAFIESTDIRGGGLVYVDLRADMLGASKTYAQTQTQAQAQTQTQAQAIYYRTDHHWNGDGAYLTYTSLGEALGYQPLPKSGFAIDIINEFYGSTYAKSGLWLTKPDILELWSPPCQVRVTVLDSSTEPDVRDSLFFTEFLEDWDKYSVFLGGIHGLTIIDNLDSANKGNTLFVVKDSYANSLMPLLIAHYDRIVAVDLRHYRGEFGALIGEYGSTGTGENHLLYVYSMNHIVNDPDIMWLR